MKAEELISLLGNCDPLIEKMDGYSTSAEVTEVDDICRLFHDELDMRDEFHRKIAATYADMTNYEVLDRLLYLYKFLVNESINTLRKELYEHA